MPTPLDNRRSQDGQSPWIDPRGSVDPGPPPIEVPQPNEPAEPVMPDPGTPGDPAAPADVPAPDEPAEPIVPEPPSELRAA